MDEEDLFAVFDSESSKSQQIVIPDTEDDNKEKEKIDSNELVGEICGSRSKRRADSEEDCGAKKMKTDVDIKTTIMTGLSDLEVKAKIEDDEKQVRGDEVETENIEEDETVVSLVEAAPR